MEETLEPSLKMPLYAYKENSKRAKRLIISQSIFIIVLILSVIAGLSQLSLIESIKEGEVLDESIFDFNDALQSFIYLATLIINIVCLVYLISWFRRAYGNLERLKLTQMNQSEIMAAISWFIPFVNLFLPLLLMFELVKKIKENIRIFSPSFIGENLNGLISLFWIIRIVMFFAGIYLYILSKSAYSNEELLETTSLSIYIDLITIFHSFILIFIVYLVSKLEDRLKKEIISQGGELMDS